MMRSFGMMGVMLPLALPLVGASTIVAPPAYAETPLAKVPVTNIEWNIDLNNAAQPLYERGDAAFVVGKPKNAGAAVPRLSLWNHRNQKLADLVASAPAADGSVTWLLPSDRMGYFEIRPTDANQSWPSLGSRPAGKLTYAVVDKINPNPSRDYKYHFLSIQGSSPAGRGGSSWDVYRYMGLQAQAQDYSWYKLEPQPSTPEKDTYADFFSKDGAPQKIRELKTWPYFYISKNPVWAVDATRAPDGLRGKTATSNLPPKDLKQYEAYLERVVPYIAKSYSYLPYRVYEVMWEPVIPWGWQGTPEEIVGMFEVVHRVVHKYDPNGRVSGPTLSSFNDISQYENLMKLGLGKYIDVSGWHMYAGYPPEKRNVPQSIARIRAINKQYTGRDLPLMGTEYGLPEGAAGTTENQAYGMTAGTLIFRAEGVAMSALFYLTDFASEPGYGLFYTDIEGLPYAPNKISPKPAIPMLRAAIDQVGAAHGISKLDYLGTDIWGYAFEDEETGELLAAVWDATGNDRSISLDTGSDKVQVIDSFGNRESRLTKDGKISLQLLRSPVYVRGLSPELFAPKGTPLLQSENVWRVFRNQRMTKPLQLNRALTEKTATVLVDMPAGVAATVNPIKLNGAQGAKSLAQLQIAPNAPLGDFAASVRVQGKSGTLYRGLQRIQVLPELQIEPAQVQNEANKWSLKSRVKNVSPVRWDGQAVLNFENTTQSRKISLAPNQEALLSFNIAAPTDATHKVTANLETRSSTGSRLSRATPLAFFSVQKAQNSDIWGKMSLLPLRTTDSTIFRTFHQSKFEGDKDLSAQAGYAYDANNLYVQYLVEDQVHRNSATSTQMWKQDSIQLGFDVAPGRAINSNGIAEGFERSSSEWGFAFTSRGPEIYLWIPPGGSNLKANSLVPDAGIRLEGGREGTTTTYRITIPWKTIDPRGLHKDALGISAAINDSDADLGFLDRRALLLFGGIIGEKDPAYYGQAQLQ